MKNRRIFLIAVACAATLGMAWLLWPAAIRRARGPLPHGVYVWQRAWTPPVLDAVLGVATNFSETVVLGAEVNWRKGQPSVFRVPLDYAVLRQSGVRAGLALRVGPFPGPFAADDERAKFLAALAASLLAEAASNHLAVAELQIDFDCAETKLAGYRRWIETIRAKVAPVPLVITALPSWLKHSDFRRLAWTADGFVLQVHSLQRPEDTSAPFVLCDPDLARQAVERAARVGRPFRVALPTYGYLAAFDTRGRFVGLSAEGPARSWPTETKLREVRADPASLAALVGGWFADRPEWLRGLIWYRLPVQSDALNWTWPTLAAVMSAQVPQTNLRVEARRPQACLVEVDLLNAGAGDSTNAPAVRLSWNDARVVASDGLAGFQAVDTGSNVFQFNNHSNSPRLKPGERQTIGWLRFDKEADVHVQIVFKNQ